MAQYDLLLTQNVAASGIEFEEKLINIGNKELLVGGAAGTLAKIAAASAVGKILKTTNADGTFSWQDNDGTVKDTFQIGVDGVKLKKSATAAQLELRNAANSAYGTLKALEAELSSLKLVGQADYSLLSFEQDALIPSSGEGFTAKKEGGDLTDIVAERVMIGNYEGVALPQEAASKHYVDNAILAGFAANDAMVMKGSITTAGEIESKDLTINEDIFGAALTTYSAGWVFLVTVAQTLEGFVLDQGDKLIAINDVTSSTFAATDWKVIQGNIVGAVSADNNLTDKALIIGDGGSNKKVKTFAFGTAGHVLKVKAGGAELEWAAENAGFANPMTAVGDLIIGDTAGAPARLPKGTQGKVLKVGATTLEWGDDSSYTHPNHSGDVTSVGDGAQTIAAGAVTLSKMADLAAFSVIGNKTDEAETPTALTKIDLAALILQVLPGEVISAPASATAAGTINEMRADDNFLYRCIQTGAAGSAKWVRTPFAKWAS